MNTLFQRKRVDIVFKYYAKNGDIIYLVDGKGGFYKATLIGDNPKSCQLKIDKVERNYGKSDLHIHIAIAPTKMNERFEWFWKSLQK